MSGKSVVLGLDRSPGAEKALALAVRLAGSLDVPLVLVHGIEPAGRVTRGRVAGHRIGRDPGPFPPVGGVP